MGNNLLQQEEKQFYRRLYENKTILIHVSNSDIADPNFVKAIQNIRALIADKIKIILVLGEENQTEACENANEVVTQIVKAQKEKIIEVIFATQTGGIQDIYGEIIPTISDKKIPCILDNKHDNIKVGDKMYQKLLTAQEILKFVDKVAITNLEGIYDEITKLSGSGTLLFNLDQTEIEPLTNNVIFDLQYKKQTQAGKWLKRTEDQKKELKENHFVLSINESPLGGFSLIEKKLKLHNQEIDGICFECWWSGTEQNGVGYYLMKQAVKIAKEKNKMLFFHTKEDLSKIKNYFGLKQYPEMKSSSGAILWTT